LGQVRIFLLFLLMTQCLQRCSYISEFSGRIDLKASIEIFAFLCTGSICEDSLDRRTLDFHASGQTSGFESWFGFRVDLHDPMSYSACQPVKKERNISCVTQRHFCYWCRAAHQNSRICSSRIIRLMRAKITVRPYRFVWDVSFE
jgi:hypothetical protein